MQVTRERKGLKNYDWNLGWSKWFDFLRDDRSTAKTVLTSREQLHAIIINLGKVKAPLLRYVNSGELRVIEHNILSEVRDFARLRERGKET